MGEAADHELLARDRAGSALEVGASCLGYHDPDGKLQYAVNVGTGWNAATAAALRKRGNCTASARHLLGSNFMTAGASCAAL